MILLAEADAIVAAIRIDLSPLAPTVHVVPTSRLVSHPSAVLLGYHQVAVHLFVACWHAVDV
jgi:hypothetical protein